VNVLQLISSEGFYGAESMLVALAEAQLRAGVNTTVAVFQHARDPHVEVAEQAAERGIETRLIPCRGRFDRSAVMRIRDLLEERRAHILHCHGYKADLYGFAASRAQRVALVSTCHNWPDQRALMRAYASSDRFALRWFDQVTTPSRRVAALLTRSGVPSRKVTVVANGIDLAPFHHAQPTLRGEIPGAPKFLIGSVARLIPGKGGVVLLHAAKTVLRVCPEAAFVFVGDGPCREEWQGLANELGIGGRVFFTGTRADMPGVYASLDVLVLPSFEEGMPMCLLEGLASACPVIATKVGEVGQVIDPGVTGLLIEPGDSSVLARAILTLIQHRPEAADLGTRGREVVTRSFSSAAMARNYGVVYERALATRSRMSAGSASGQEKADSA
jgi:glycosyltransferase involved in cell wall biosynthesis